MNADEWAAITNAEFLMDTNILAYSFDAASPIKQAIANQLIESAMQTGNGIISSQVVQELISLSKRKFDPPLTTTHQRILLDKLLLPLCRHYPYSGFYARALNIMVETGFAFYDALIVTAAIDCRCQYLLSEDMQHERVVQGVQIVNPFI
ncbi:MAG: PIN domain-containing protein [Anaerolineae bacterium]|nr:PIN domain-containing protein [Anaerolineae bacterium]